MKPKNNPLHPGKSTNAEVSNRILDVYEKMVQGYANHEIYAHFKKTYGMPSRAADWYMKKARKKITENNDATMQELRSHTNEQLTHLYKLAYFEGKYNDCLAILKQKSKINGLEVINMNHTGEISLVIDKVDNDL
jgi:hypothetical protein